MLPKKIHFLTLLTGMFLLSHCGGGEIVMNPAIPSGTASGDVAQDPVVAQGEAAGTEAVIAEPVPLPEPENGLHTNPNPSPPDEPVPPPNFDGNQPWVDEFEDLGSSRAL